jgi:hypothetical protein
LEVPRALTFDHTWSLVAERVARLDQMSVLEVWSAPILDQMSVFAE